MFSFWKRKKRNEKKATSDAFDYAALVDGSDASKAADPGHPSHGHAHDTGSTPGHSDAGGSHHSCSSHSCGGHSCGGGH
jgi:hypothetical protein